VKFDIVIPSSQISNEGPTCEVWYWIKWD